MVKFPTLQNSLPILCCPLGYFRSLLAPMFPRPRHKSLKIIYNQSFKLNMVGIKLWLKLTRDLRDDSSATRSRSGSSRSLSSWSMLDPNESSSSLSSCSVTSPAARPHCGFPSPSLSSPSSSSESTVGVKGKRPARNEIMTCHFKMR